MYAVLKRRAGHFFCSHWTRSFSSVRFVEGKAPFHLSYLPLSVALWCILQLSLIEERFTSVEDVEQTNNSVSWWKFLWRDWFILKRKLYIGLNIFNIKTHLCLFHGNQFVIICLSFISVVCTQTANKDDKFVCYSLIGYLGIFDDQPVTV